ncbi:MAG: archaeosortase A [Candidatus Poseidoniaceae archaeon]|nr:archaeosortase A [Candidatus Poseidoniaceae archaeon]
MTTLPEPHSALIFLGLLFLGIGFHGRKLAISSRSSALGWILFCAFFFLTTPYYVEISDPVLVVMCAASLPIGIALAIWEVKSSGATPDHLSWLRGAVFWAGLPYMLVDKVPWMNVLAIWFVAWQTSLYLRWTGSGDIHLGETYVHMEGQAPVRWQDWGGNRWFMESGGAEHAFYTDLVTSTGEPIGIHFILSCTALQSMIIFVGAIVALQSAPWQRRARALLISVPLIHILNVFRNAGLVWLHTNYDGWTWLSMNMFHFGHSYAAKVGSLAAMFMMALVLFELLPQMHRHIIELMAKVYPFKNQTLRQS